MQLIRTDCTFLLMKMTTCKINCLVRCDTLIFCSYITQFACIHVSEKAALEEP